MRKISKILMYHSIGSKGNGEIGSKLYSVSKKDFKKQMEYVKSLANQEVMVTFDDGDITNFKHAYPILKDLNISAYFFIIVSKVGTRGYMNWEEIKALRDSGMTIGSHGMTHKILTELDDTDLDYDLRASKKFLEDNMGHRIHYFSVPRGFYNKKTVEKAKEVGYKGIFTSNIYDNDGFRFGRIPVKASWDMRYFIKMFDNGFSIKEKTGELIKNSSKKILGAKYYDKIRTGILKE